MNYLKAEPFEWTSPMGRETPPWKIPTKINPTSQWVIILKTCNTHLKVKEIAALTKFNSISITHNLFNLWESGLIDKFYEISPKTNKPISRIAYKISTKGRKLLTKYGLI